MADTIGLCLDSVSRLNFPAENLEIIVVDNNSDDGTEQIVQKYPFKILKQKEFQSAYASRNAAIREAAGEFIAFTDADCIVDPDWLTEIAKHLGEPQVGCFAGEILSYPANSLVERFSEHIGLLRQNGPMSGWHHRPYAQTANAVYRADVFRVAGLFHPTMKSGGDADIAWRMQDRAKLGLKFVPEAKVFHRHRIDAQALYSQFRRYGTGKLSWALHHADYKLPALSKLEGEVVKAFGSAMEALEKSAAPEEPAAYPVLQSLTSAAHYIGYLQSAATLAARAEKQDGLPALAVSRSPRCPVCSGTTFKPAPGRNQGSAPICADCGALERHRTAASIMRMAPIELTEGKRHLCVGETLNLVKSPFAETIEAQFEAEAIAAPTASFAWVTSMNGLPFVADDRKALADLLRCCEGGGVLLLLAPVEARFRTIDLERANSSDPYRAYGMDLSAKLAGWFPQMRAMTVSIPDAASGSRDTAHLLSSSLASLALIDRGLKRDPDIASVLLN